MHLNQIKIIYIDFNRLLFNFRMIFYTTPVGLINYTSIIFYTNLFSLINYTSIVFYTNNNKLEKTNLSRSTFNKYLTNLKYKGIITYIGKKYAIEDDMLKTWLQHEKEVNGFYPI